MDSVITKQSQKVIAEIEDSLVEVDFDQNPYQNIPSKGSRIFEESKESTYKSKKQSHKNSKLLDYIDVENYEFPDDSSVAPDRKRKIPKYLRKSQPCPPEVIDYSETDNNVSPSAEKQSVKCFASRNSPLSHISSPSTSRKKPGNGKLSPKSLKKKSRWITPIRESLRIPRREQGLAKLPGSISSYIYYNDTKKDYMVRIP